MVRDTAQFATTDPLGSDPNWGLTLGKLGSDPKRGLTLTPSVLRQPIAWLAAGLFAALLAACILTIVLALGQSDGALPNVGERVLSVPAAPAGIPE